MRTIRAYTREERLRVLEELTPRIAAWLASCRGVQLGEGDLDRLTPR